MNAVKQNRLGPDAALIITLALLPCLFFWRLITPNPADRMFIAAGDFTEQYFPLRAFTAQEWVRGQIPLWNPYLYGGQPALADIQSGALYPPHVLESLLLGWGGSLLGREIGFPLWALEWQVIVHFSLAAVGTYLFARSCFIRSLSPLRFASPRAEPGDEASSPRSLQSDISLRRARFGGVITSLVFTYGGYLTSFPVQQITILEVSAWLPWVMWAVSAAAARPLTADRQTPNDNTSRLLASLLPRSSAPFWGALAFAMAILAGHPQTVLYIFYLSLAYTLFRAFNDSTIQRLSEPRTSAQSPLGTHHAPRLTYHISRLLRSLIPWFIIVLLGAAIAAAQLLPTLEFITRSLRADLSYQAVSAGLPLNEFISILYPGFFGGSPEYVGIVSLVLIALALTITSNTSRARCFRSQDIFFWAGAGLVGLLLAFGGNTFLYPLFYLLTPGFEAVRQQERAFLVYSFSAAMLAGYGALVLAGPLPKLVRSGYALFEYRLRQVAVVALALTAFFIYGSAVVTARGDEVNLFYGVLWQHLFGLVILGGMLVLLILRSQRWLRRTWGMSLVTLWLAFNLFTVNWRFNLEKPTIPPPFTPNGVTNFLQTNLPTLQVESEPTKSPKGRRSAQSADEVPQGEAKRSGQRGQAPYPQGAFGSGQDEAFQPSNLPPMGRIVSGGLLPGGNSAASIYNLQDLTGNTPLQLAAVDTFLHQMPAWRAWQLLNVRYIVDNRNIADAGLALVFEEGDLKVFEMGDPFPRAWFVAGTEVVADEGQALAGLASDAFDLRRTAIVATPLDLPPSDSSASTVTIMNFGPSHLTAKVNALDQQLLVFSQIHYPGWQAKIDEQPAELLRVNVIQQGVVVPAGQHTVELTFSSRSFWLGTVISITAVLICFILLIWSYKESKLQA